MTNTSRPVIVAGCFWKLGGEVSPRGDFHVTPEFPYRPEHYSVYKKTYAIKMIYKTLA